MERLFNKGTELGKSRRTVHARVPQRDQTLVPPENVAGKAHAAFRCLVKSALSLQKATSAQQQREIVAQMQDHVSSLWCLLATDHLRMLAALAEALDKLFAAFSRELDSITPSSLRTVSRALDLLNSALAKPGLHLPADLTFRILVVDDNPVCRRALCMALRTPELKLTVCESGADALEILTNQEYDVVFSDIMMPGLNGFAMASVMRKFPHHARTPVVYVTVLSDFETRAKSVLSGGCDLIAKPFSSSEVIVKALSIGLKGYLDTPQNPAAATGVSACALRSAAEESRFE